jgi:hypothetical protein
MVKGLPSIMSSDHSMFDMLSSYQVLHTSVYDEEKKCWGPHLSKSVSKDVEAYSYTKFVIETGKKH